MATDTTKSPDKKLTGAALAAPDGATPVVVAGASSGALDPPVADPAAIPSAEPVIQPAPGPVTTPGIDPDFAAGMEPDETAALKAEVATLHDKLAGWEQQRDGLLEDTAKALKARDAAEARADKAEAALKAKPKTVTAKPAEKKPRTFAVVGTALDRDALKAALADAEDVEIAFVDADGREVAGSQPVTVSGEVWKDHAIGLMQSEPVEIHGPATGSPGFEIAGYALLIDGKTIATTTRSEPLRVFGGQTVKLVDDIAF